MVGRKLMLVEGKGYSVRKADQSVPVSKCKENEFSRSFFVGKDVLNISTGIINDLTIIIIN